MAESPRRSKNDWRRTKCTSHNYGHEDTALLRNRTCQQLVVYFLLVWGFMWSTMYIFWVKFISIYVIIWNISCPLFLPRRDFQWLYSNLSFCTKRYILIVSKWIASMVQWKSQWHDSWKKFYPFISCKRNATLPRHGAHTQNGWPPQLSREYLTHIILCKVW